MYLLTAQELRQTLKLSERAYFRWLNRGMPSIGYGHIRRFRLEEVIEWLRQTGRQGTQQ
jgi:phage terminase Nu1 subunit (DNA packaging protein)